MVTAVAMLFLIATVVYALSQMLNIGGGNVVDGQRHADSNAAFFLAESGVEAAQASLAIGLSGNITNANCTGIATSIPSLGLGSVTVTAASTPAACDDSGVTPCTSCTVTSTGTVGRSKRQVQRTISLAIVNGTSCSTNCGNTPVTWQLSLRNVNANNALAVFNLVYLGQGNNTADPGVCDTAGGYVCKMQSNLDSGSGSGSVAQQVNTVVIPGTKSTSIYQTLTQPARPAVEVGAFFRGTTAPSLAGVNTADGAASYWSNKSSTDDKTIWTGGLPVTGGTNNGTATSTGTCTAPKTGNNLNNTQQACTNWCYGGDALLFNFAASVTDITAPLTGVSFGNNAVEMTRVVKYPTPDVTGAARTVHAETWVKRNANFSPASAPNAVNVSSYKGRGSAAMGARWTSNGSDTTSVVGSTTNLLTVGASFTGWPFQLISEGDTISYTGGTGTPACTAGATCATIGTQLAPTAGEQLGGRGRYNISPGALAVSAVDGRVWTVKSNIVRVSACTICNLVSGDASNRGLISGRTLGAQQAPATYGAVIEAAGGAGRYATTLTATGAPSPTYLPSATTLYVGIPDNTLYMPAASSKPLAADLPMRVAFKSGSEGVFAAAPGGTTVTAVSAPNAATTAMTLTTAPGTALDDATLCAGTCAFFVQTAGAKTPFTLSGLTGNFTQWAGSFTCLKGVTVDPEIVTSTTTGTGRWTETIN